MGAEAGTKERRQKALGCASGSTSAAQRGLPVTGSEMQSLENLQAVLPAHRSFYSRFAGAQPWTVLGV